MPSPTNTEPYKNHRFPGEIISHGVWLYYRFSLSYRDVEEMLMARGIVVTYGAIRQWCRKFGQDYANQLKRRRPRPGDRWHLDEVFLTITGQRHSLWRAVDQDENVLDILVQSRRNKVVVLLPLAPGCGVARASGPLKTSSVSRASCHGLSDPVGCRPCLYRCWWTRCLMPCLLSPDPHQGGTP